MKNYYGALAIITIFSVSFMLGIKWKAETIVQETVDYYYEQYKELSQYCYMADRYQMYVPMNSSMRFVNGIYRTNKYYCVWTGGRPEEEWLRTECHEQCHALIAQGNYEHFCEGGLEK